LFGGFIVIVLLELLVVSSGSATLQPVEPKSCGLWGSGSAIRELLSLVRYT